jgi:class 3 adenylate cyclase
MLLASPVIDWLLRDAASSASPGAMLAELCGRLVADGLPLAGALLTIASLDPMVARNRLRWGRADGRVVNEIQLHGKLHGTTPVETRPRGEGASLVLTFPGTSHEIEWHAAEPSGHPAEPDGFDSAHRAYLDTVCVAMAAPLQVLVGRDLTRNLLQAYLGRRSADRVLNGTVRRGTGEMIEAVVWISDLRDFTRLSETLPSDQVITALNDCCARLVGAIHPFGGEVLKFIGDGLLAIFPLAARGAAGACDAALAAVRASREGMAHLDAERLRAGLPPLPFGVGLHLGAVMYGNIGAPDRLDFTAIGPAVNLASRIEGLCRPLGCPVLISEAVSTACSAELAPLGRHSVRGSTHPIALYTLPELASASSLS